MAHRDRQARAASRWLLAAGQRELQRIVLDMHDGPQHEARTDQRIELSIDPDVGDCALATKIAIYRIVQEPPRASGTCGP